MQIFNIDTDHFKISMADILPIYSTILRIETLTTVSP